MAAARDTEKVEVENVNVPGSTTRVDATMYRAARLALLQALPDAPPGLTQAEMIDATKRHLPEDLFPGGAKAGWWVKCVQLDLEAKGLVVRDRAAKPLRWRRGAGAS
ncbi:MAG: hypothetical protein P1P87_04490 [Trueperaceae bacterium]|nr:hypothetical protein [Trueperaceae bacterium]